MPSSARQPTVKKPSAKRKSTSAKRLPQDERRRVIIEQAIRFFAEKGFGATTRELAERIGVAQPLLFQHFATKSDLIAAVFDTLFDRMSSRHWRMAFEDTHLALRERLVNLFHRYAVGLYDYHWIRIYMFAGLEGGSFNRTFISKVTEPLLRDVAVQIRREFLLRDSEPGDVTAKELDVIWLLHGGIYYSAIRKQIYGLPVDDDALRELIQHGVDGMLFSMRNMLVPEEAPKAGGRARKAAVR